MWVNTPLGVGIIFSLENNNILIHLVDKDGITIKEQYFKLSELTQAKIKQIPIARLINVPNNKLKKMGYA